MSSWKKRMHAEMDRELRLETAMGDKDYASYRENLRKEELQKVLDYSQKSPQNAKLPTKAGLCTEIRRWDKNVDEAKLKKAHRDELIRMLCKALNHSPRRWVSAKRYHRFGLSFDYQGNFPPIKYSEDMSGDELRAMLELYANPKISVAQIKGALKKHDWNPKLSGSKDELLTRLRDALGCKDLNKEWVSYTLVGCWQEDYHSMQDMFNEERDAWKADLEASKENSALFAKSKTDRKAVKEEQVAKKLKAQEMAASRPWKAKYNPKTKSRIEFEAEWKQRHPALSFPYSGTILPPPDAFSAVYADYKANPYDNAHHLLAYLEKGYGKFELIARGEVSHKYMDKATLNMIHGRPCKTLGNSHQYAVEVLRRQVQSEAHYRYTHGK